MRMAVRTPAELRISAERFREMAGEGEDPRLHAALLLVADEFEREAARVETLERGIVSASAPPWPFRTARPGGSSARAAKPPDLVET
jgi:hypothetical protein